MRILLVEDELRLADALRAVLEWERFVVAHADRFETAREAATLACCR
ncbi:response regulator [Roseivivax sediminis]|nr:response regulator transcription factor [Roseivivax sediminis]